MDRACKLLDYVHGKDGRLRLAVDSVIERAAANVLQRQVRSSLVLADLVDLNYIRVPQRRDRLGFQQKTLTILLVGLTAAEDHLQRHQPIEPLLPRLVDDSHAAAADHFLDLVAWNADAGGPGCGRRIDPL